MQVVGAWVTPAGYFWVDERAESVVRGPQPVEVSGLVVPGTAALLAITDGTSNTTLLTQRFGDCYATHCVYGSGHPPQQAVYAPDRLPQLGISARSCVGGAAQTTIHGGILVALCDGSVRTVGEGGVKSTWFAARTPAGGEVIGDW